MSSGDPGTLSFVDSLSPTGAVGGGMASASGADGWSNRDTDRRPSNRGALSRVDPYSATAFLPFSDTSLKPLNRKLFAELHTCILPPDAYDWLG